jgi:hypothetical protein
MGRFNFWQWLGILIIIVAAGAMVWRNTGQVANPPSATQPAR